MIYMIYTVISGFTERLNGVKSYAVGDEYMPHSDERTSLLVAKGFITDQEPAAPTVEGKPKANQRRGKKVDGDGSATEQPK